MRLGRLAIPAAAALACGGDDYGTGPGGCAPTATQICMTSATFNPTTLTVPSGTTVTWRDGSGLAHTVTSSPGAADNFDQPVAPGGTFSGNFTLAGNYPYYCKNHGTPASGMRGTLVVN